MKPLYLVMCLITTCFCESKLNLSTSKVMDIFGVSTKMPVRNLLDEQELAGDPLNDLFNARKCKTPWLPSSYNDYYPISYPEYPGPAAVIVLEAIYKITNICIDIVNSNSSTWSNFNLTLNFTLYNPFELPLLSFSTEINATWSEHNNGWNCFNITNYGAVHAAFITVSLYNPPSTSLTEMVIYGSPSSLPKRRKNNRNTIKTEKKSLMHLLGSTGYGWISTKNFSNTIGAFRQWQMWPWIEGGGNKNYPGYPNNQNRYECTTLTGVNAFCQDDVLKEQRKNNVSVHAVLWNTPQWIHKSQWKPIDDDILHQYGATVTPSSYIMMADHLFQKTARYGRVNVDSDLLKLAPNKSLNDSSPQPVLSGLDLLDWIETWNEPNCGGGKGGREFYWSNIEIVAMQSAVYDGHLFSMPNTVGIKTADPSMNVSFAGLCGGSDDSSTSDDFYGILYNWQTILWWSDYYRNGSIPAEAIAYHFYARNCTGCWPTIGVSPEEYGVYEMASKLVQWRDENMPSIQVWLTEWGYDTVSPSEILAPPIGSFDSEQVQGIWIMRTILATHAAGIDRSTQFVWSDACSAGSWCTAGLVDINYKPKKSYYYFVAMYRNLKDYYFVSRDCQKMNGSVCIQIYEYNGNYAYILWCPTSKDQMVHDYVLSIGDVSNASLITPTIGNPNGKKSNLKVNEQTVHLDISELPVFVIANNM